MAKRNAATVAGIKFCNRTGVVEAEQNVKHEDRTDKYVD